MARTPARYTYAFGPGGITPVVKGLIIANVAVFVMQVVLGLASPTTMRAVFEPFALAPRDVVQRGWLWQLVTYMFLHGGVFHILFNMLSLWMFGTDLERRWGTPFFLKFYAVTGIGSGALTVLFSLLPFAPAQHLYVSTIIGASGAIFG